MKSICLCFQVHQPFKHRRYRFFDIGNDHYYYDDYANDAHMRQMADKSYLPANKLFLHLIEKMKGKFKVAFSISGVALEQFELYAPEVLKSFQALADTGCVEFLAETYSHSLVSLANHEQFEKQVRDHEKKIEILFNQKTRVFRNTEMIYSDAIGAQVYRMGFKGMFTEGARHVLGWKSPNFVYINAQNPRLKILMRNYKLSDDLSFRFSNTNWSEYPLTADKFISWMNRLDPKEEVINLLLNYLTLGMRQPRDSGIFEFMEHWVTQAGSSENFKFATPSEVLNELQPMSVLSVPHPISWADEERDLTSWLGNDLQKEAFEKLYALSRRMHNCANEELSKDWNYLQDGDHFYGMSTRFFSHGEDKNNTHTFGSPYEAFINYMNVLSDFKIRINTITPENQVEHQVAALHKLIDEKENKIKKLEHAIEQLNKPKPGAKKRKPTK
jgi:alpha-amylase